MKKPRNRTSFVSRRLPYTKLSKQLDRICDEQRSVIPEVLRSIIELAIEIAREGREGRKIGTLFVVGEEDSVLRLSHPLILDPLHGHELDSKRIEDPNVRETVKELAQLDGAFVVSSEGHVLSAARYIDADSKNIDIPLGLGSRHVAAVSITRETDAVAVLVSESSVVRIMVGGKLVAEIIPELWLFHREASHISEATVEEIEEKNIAVISGKRVPSPQN
ncbi:MAG TPA: diadenylate cyclase [Terriglobia bacterium]|nr:diadenylate cyclase [Terriglobia bacterium]